MDLKQVGPHRTGKTELSEPEAGLKKTTNLIQLQNSFFSKLTLLILI
jgi:hypothetical protein